jgi:uncharacterized protein YbjT (DUF2867 family)
MNIVVAGGIGFVGHALCMALSLGGHKGSTLTRNSGSAARLFGNNMLPVEWNGSMQRWTLHFTPCFLKRQRTAE